jgi:hypothetical protein
MEERRREPRFRTLKSGTISLAGGSVECRIINLSTAGACLEINGTKAIPDTFKLMVKPDNVLRTCKVIWQQYNRVGVFFS